MSKREVSDPGRPGRLTTNSHDQSAARKSAPDSARGAVTAFSTARFYCAECKELRKVKSVSHNIIQLPASATYDATLECSHVRTITVNVKRPTKKAVTRVPDTETHIA
jgi:hypothetical protein